MFRKFANKLSNTLEQLTNNTTEEENKMNQLVQMGFDRQAAQQALRRHDGHLERAAEDLLTRQQQPPMQQNDDADLQRALQASLEQEPAVVATRPPPTAAATRAGRAALARHEEQNNKKKSSKSKSPPPALPSHPNVQVPPQFADKTKEERILRCAQRLQAHSQAVDTLLRTLTKLQENPNDSRLRLIDTTTPVFQSTLAKAPGAVDLLLAMNYYYLHNKTKLKLDVHDPATLYLGISALQQAKESKDYQQAKALLVFAKEVDQIMHSADDSTEEALQRADFLRRLPSSGQGALIHVEFQGTLHKFSRNFDGDDTLQDVLHWIGGHGSEFLTKLQSGDYQIVDGHRHPPFVISVQDEAVQHQTLQYIGCWPSGKLIVRPAVLASLAEDSSVAGGTQGSAVGLGAARASWTPTK